MTAAIITKLPTVEPEATSEVGSILLDKAMLKDLWERQIVDTKTYINFALILEYGWSGDFNIDLEFFKFNWRGDPDHQTGKIKELTDNQIRDAITALQKKSLAKAPHRIQLTLQFDIGGVDLD